MGTKPIIDNFLWNKFINLQWVKKSKPEIIDEIKKISEDRTDLLSQLISLKHGNNKSIVEIVEIKHLEKLVIISFKLKSDLTNQEWVEESLFELLVKNNNGKAVILVSIKGKIKFILVKDEFNIWAKEEVIGPFDFYYPDFSQTKTVNIPVKLEKEIKSIFNISEIKIRRFIDLGKLYSDLEISGKSVQVFAVVIEIDNQPTDKKENGVKVIEIDQVDKIIEKSNSVFLPTILAKLKIYSII